MLARCDHCKVNILLVTADSHIEHSVLQKRLYVFRQVSPQSRTMQILYITVFPRHIVGLLQIEEDRYHML